MKKAPHRPYRQISARRLPLAFVLSAALAATPFVSMWLIPVGVLGMIFFMFTLDEWCKPTKRQWEQAGKFN